MRRLIVTASVGVAVLLAFAPASAVARHHHRRHHGRTHHARIERFGDVNNMPATSSSPDNAGTVQSFHNGVLTIVLNDGSTITGRVTNDTELECMAPEQNQTMHEDGDRGDGDQSGDGDNSGSGDNQAQASGDQSSGEDQGDAAEQNDNQAEDQNENEAAEENENEMENNCSTSHLTPGTIVHEAELRISSTGSIWKKVELES